MAAGGLAHPLLYMEILNKALGTTIPLHVWYTWLAMAILFTCGLLIRSRVSLVPGGLQNLFEVIVGGLEDFVVANLGEGGRKVFPVLITIFVFILTMNYLGLIPGCDAPTANVNTNAAMAIFVFLYYHYIGIKKWGFGYIKHFMGPVAFLAPLMLVLEIVSHLARPLSLTLRLFGNIRGEEIVLVLLFTLAPVVGTLPMYFLFILGKTIQAFIFFMLATIYLKGSMDHAH
ncbi:MAG TPA: F0F1 ATP synthase subunit A [Desulfovibrio sp.]|jgi:F-type H+-transporting ATPase subunit a|uniref:F0F1 ATP synthase subunit A n=1 Tax=Desulfovibrio TaxID=872 RepID=UPI0004171ADB|nr:MULTISPECIES: F0F1 ATP synthase subunit A [Desulfovibrio]MDY0305172.1 F0F1 ATP synthase subunit A [Desulfovibrionaceae bacterium]HMM38634.1 F0F1 ATP synthase subunit A [Desulfovibrio sp.]